MAYRRSIKLLAKFMRRLCGVLTVCTIAGGSAWAATPCTTDDNSIINDGSCWNTLSQPEHISIVRGMWVGSDATDLARGLVGQSFSGYSSIDWLSMPKETTAGDIAASFNQLYKIPANRKISWSYALLLAALAARDDDSNDADKLVSFLRRHKALPVWGKLVGVTAVNKIKVETDDGTIDIRLAGVAAGGKFADLGVTMLRAMSHTPGGSGPYDCQHAETASVSIEYGSDLFDENGDLTASVAIFPYLGICAGTEMIPFPNTTKLYVNYFLLGNGLASPSQKTDPKWDEARNRVYGALILSSQFAQQKSLYLFGDAKDDQVEAISKAMNASKPQ